MSRRPRRNHSAEFKARVTLAELATPFDGHPNQRKGLLEKR